MKITAAATLIAASLAVSMIDGTAPAQAAMPICYQAARHYRNNFSYEPPAYCWGSSWFRSTDGQHWDRPLPANQNQGTRPPPPAPPSDIPPLPPGADDDVPPPQP